MPTRPHKHTNYEWLIVGVIILVAVVFRFQDIKTIPPGLYPDEAMNGNNALNAIATDDYKIFYPDNNGREGLFINIQAQSIRLFGNHPWALRVVSGMFGTLTVLGLYFLTRKLFNREIAAMSSFLLAVSFWHVLFSRIGFRAIMAPFFLVWGLYFFWKGKTSLRLWDFGLAGIMLGLGFHSYIAYRIVPLIVILALTAYWYAVKKDFAHDKYIHTRNQLIRGFAMLMLTAIFVALPLLWYYFVHPTDFLGRTAQISIFSSSHPLQNFITNAIKTHNMFNFTGDWNWRHNFAGAPQLLWPVGVMFVIGFIRSWIKLFKTKRKHGHFSTVQVLLLSWFFLGLLPVVLSTEGLPHALRAIIAAPVVFIFAGEGLWWLYDFCRKKYQHSLLVSAAICILLFAIMINEYDRYFNQWAHNSNVAEAYAADYVALGEKLNAMPRDQKKYVLVNGDGVLVNNIPMPAQTVMFITDTWTPEKQEAKNIFYITTALKHPDGTVFPLNK